MFSIKPCSPPIDSLLNKYVRDENYTDCYQIEISATVSQLQYVNAFYTTLVFKLERVILKWALSKPSFDYQARQLAEGTTDKFAAWHVENRSESQLLLSDFQGYTRSWLMTLPVEIENTKKTRLYFGSAVIPAQNPKTGRMRSGLGFRVLLGFHKIYSQVLLHAAKTRLIRQLF